MKNSFSKSSIRQPSAMRIHVPKKVAFGMKSSVNTAVVEKPPVQIIEDSKAEIVYWTENGTDKKSWDIIFPEYKVLTEAFRGGYGWYDLTEGHGQHLLPKPKPYKIVKVSSAELKAIRAKEEKEKEEQACEAITAKTKNMITDNLSIERTEYEAAEREAAIREAAEREAAIREAAEREAAIREAAERESAACEDTYSEQINMPEYVLHASNKIIAEIQLLDVKFLYQDYLVDFISNRLFHYKDTARDAIATLVCEIVERHGLLNIKADIKPALPQPPQPLQQLDEIIYQYNYEDIKMFFEANPPFYHAGYRYLPFVYHDGRKLLVPEVYISRDIGKNITICYPLPPIFSATQLNIYFHDMQNFLCEPNLHIADEVFMPNIAFDGRNIYMPKKNIVTYIPLMLLPPPPPAPLPPPPPPPPPPYYSAQSKTPYIKCTNAYCQMCNPLPIINAVLLTASQPPNTKIIKTITMLPPPQVRTKKVRMPRMKRLRQLIG
jgi:hypothetical protein